jgi:hypothetical protein
MLPILLILSASRRGVCELAHKASEICRPPDPRFPASPSLTVFKANRLQRQSDLLDKRVDRRPDEIEKKKTAREANQE